MTFSDLLRVEPGSTPDLAATDASATPAFDGDKDAARARLKELKQELAEFQERLWAEQGQSLLIVLQALDAGGKDGTIRKVFSGVNPQGCRVWSFKQPSAEELAHDFLWRIHHRAPPRGTITVFNRSHYEDVLVVRVRALAPPEVWQPRYEQINDFERILAANGTRILKFYLHISKAEQKERFQARLDDPTKRWKFAVGDLAERERWGDYLAAYTDALRRCSTADAPWYVVPADQKWYRNLVIARTVVAALEDMDPQYPEPEEGLDQVVIPD
jgi:PPK2 family polyphosphate:nucleotide phosphotransferase